MLAQLTPSSFCTQTLFSKNRHLPPPIRIRAPQLSQRWDNSAAACSVHSTLVVPRRGEDDSAQDQEEEEEEARAKWRGVGSDITEVQKEAISRLSPKMSNRCKALMKRLICFNPEEESLSLLLASWVKAMKPRRADWLVVLKEMKLSDNPLFPEVMEWAFLEDSFEANIRDYTKLIDTYAKNNCIDSAERAFQAMKSRGFPCDQVTLTVLINMYSKAGHLDRAREVFQDIQLLGLPLDNRAYSSMIMAYVRAGMLDLAESLMKDMEAKEIYAGREVYKALLRAYSTVGNADGAQRVFDAIQFARIVPDSKLCALLINAYSMEGRSDEALSVLENMMSVGLKPNDKCIALILGAYERENSLHKALALLKDLEDDGIMIDQESSDVLKRWFQTLGIADHELQHVLQKLSSAREKRKVETAKRNKEYHLPRNVQD